MGGLSNLWGRNKCTHGFMGNAVENRPLGRSRRKREDNIKKYLKETGLKGVDWVGLTG